MPSMGDTVSVSLTKQHLVKIPLAISQLRSNVWIVRIVNSLVSRKLLIDV